MNKPTDPPQGNVPYNVQKDEKCTSECTKPTPEEIADAIWEQCRIFWMENPDLSKEEIINQIAAAIRDAAAVRVPRIKRPDSSVMDSYEMNDSYSRIDFMNELRRLNPDAVFIDDLSPARFEDDEV